MLASTFAAPVLAAKKGEAAVTPAVDRTVIFVDEINT
jgi:hypothetical protein